VSRKKGGGVGKSGYGYRSRQKGKSKDYIDRELGFHSKKGKVGGVKPRGENIAKKTTRGEEE